MYFSSVARCFLSVLSGSSLPRVSPATYAAAPAIISPIPPIMLPENKTIKPIANNALLAASKISASVDFIADTISWYLLVSAPVVVPVAPPPIVDGKKLSLFVSVDSAAWLDRIWISSNPASVFLISLFNCSWFSACCWIFVATCFVLSFCLSNFLPVNIS